MKIKKWSGSAWVQEYPEVDVNNIVATGTPSSSTFLRGDGQWISVDSGNQFVNITGDTMTGNLQVGLTSADYKTILGTNALQFDRDGTSYIDQKGTGNLAFRFGSGYATHMTLTNDGKLGIGDSTPSYKLEVAGDIAVNKIFDRNNGSYYLDPGAHSILNTVNVQRLEVEGAIYDVENDQLRMPLPKGGYYTNGSSNVTGAIEITLPSGTHGNYSMISFFVDVFDYNGGADGESFTMHLGGYVNGSTWTHTFANMVTVGRTDRFFNVRYNVDGTANKIYIGETTNNWSYPKIQIRDLMAGHSGADDGDWYNNAFTIDITTTIDGTTAREKSLESVATWADQVDTNSSGSTSYYNLLWHSGDTVYYAADNKLRVQPSTGNIQIDGNDVATQNYVDLEIAQLVASAPTTLDTLNELAAALGDDPNFATTVTNSIATKLPLTGGTLTGTLTSKAIAMQNFNLTGVNMLEFNDPGPNEGIQWNGGNFRIYESPDDLTTNSAGNLQFVTGGVRRMTVGNDGYLYVSNTVQTPQLQMTSNPSRTKLRVWSGGTYGMGMTSGFTYGGLGASGGEYAMTFQMNDDADRGFWWGHSVHTTAQGAMALTTDGELTVANAIRVGYGEADTTTPSTYAVDANGDIQISNSNPVLRLNDTGTTTGDAYIDYQAGTSLKIHAGGDAITFIAGNSEKARITAGNGYLGVGTTNPSYGLDVHANDGQIRAYGTIAKLWAEASDSGQASLELKNTEGHLRFITDNGAFQLYDQIDAASRFEIDTNGNSKFFGNLTVQSSFPRIYLTDTDHNSDYSILNSNGSYIIYDDTNGANRFRINSSGNAVIGDANPSNIGFLEKSLEIQAGSSSDTTLKQAGLVISGSSDADDADDFAYVSFRNNHSSMSNDRVAEIRVMKNGTDVDKADMHFYTSNGSSLGARLSILNSGNVGIGTTNPDEKLHIEGNILVDAYNNSPGDSGIFFREGYTASQPSGAEQPYNVSITLYDGSNGGASYDGLSLNGFDGVAVRTNNDSTPKMVVKKDGNVGIGDTTPQGKLTVEQNMTNGGSAFSTPHLALNASNTTDNTGFVGMTLATSTADNYGWSYGAQRTSSGIGDLRWRNHSGTSAGNDRMILTSGGNLGVGVSSPSYAVDVSGDVNVTGNFKINGANLEAGGNTWTEIKTGSTTISSGTAVTNVSLGSNTVDDTTVLAIEINSGVVTSYTSEIIIVKLEDSDNSAAGILYNASANSSSIQVGSVRVFRTLSMGPTSTSISFTDVYYFTNGSSSETADTIYVGKIWKLGVTGS